MDRGRVRAVSAVGAAVLLLCSCGKGDGAPGVTALRRVNESQYRQTVADLFGDKIQITGRFEPEARRNGLFAVGAGQLTITSAGFEQYYAIASSVADQALAEAQRASSVPCSPADAAQPDDACAAQFVTQYGRRLFRRPLTPEETRARVSLAAHGAGGFYDGLKLALTSLMTSPEFLFRVERSEWDPSRRGRLRLDAYSVASRLSYLLWNTAPDDELLQAAESGEIQSEAGLRKQVARLVASPRLEAGVRALFTDFLQFELFNNVTKDAQLYPKFSQLVARSAQEQTLRTVVDQLLVQDADYRDLFTTRDTFIDRSLAAVYQVPYGFDAEWSRYSFPEESGRAGILTQTAFLSLFSHPGDSSPTKRGVAVYEIFKCSPTPEPPANVDFSVVNNVNNPALPTRRARLIAHATDEVCAGCHKKSDPIGLALEHFDSLGQERRTDDQALIDLSVQIGGAQYEGASGLGRALHDDPSVSSCFVDQVYAYGAGRAPAAADEPLRKALREGFAASGHRLRPLLEKLASDPAFYRVLPPAPPAKPAPKQRVASADAAKPPTGGTQ